jgi:imidazole glycerol-phosphate synthase subunit HisH
VIALIDYQAGNLTSVKKALATIGAEVVVPSAPEQLCDASGVIVPGVGHFGATRALAGAWTDAILARVGEGRPLLGICLGMQWLYEGSDEAPDVPGLGLLSGQCYRLGGATVRLKPDSTSDDSMVRLKPDTTSDDSMVRLKPDTTFDDPMVRLKPDTTSDARSVRLQADRGVKVPHVGWNSLSIQQNTSIVEGVPQDSQVYFTHSYVGPVNGDTVAVTEHGETFAAIVQRGHVAGVQFHPEKSGEVGLRILRNFMELVA